jgi:hypothetical protein
VYTVYTIIHINDYITTLVCVFYAPTDISQLLVCQIRDPTEIQHVFGISVCSVLAPLQAPGLLIRQQVDYSVFDSRWGA